MRNQPRGQLFVRALSKAATRGVLLAGGHPLPCALGRSGRRVIKREGDGATPTGTYGLESVFYRPDRGLRPPTGLPLQVLTPTDGWCDEPTDRNYNRRVRHPYAASAEKMWRQDGLYDLIVVLDCNRKPRVRGRGSAIFIHVARPGFAPTEGCIALRRPDLLRVLAHLRRGARVHIP
jgi:L,D-peptidoglycan transpeptidase YkuD (ErfK/YbiS/YcfS/YnhG family)